MTTAATDELRKALASEEGGRAWLRRLGYVGGVALFVAVGLGYRVRHRPPAASRFLTSDVHVADVAEKVQATGTVQPVLQINVGAQVNGRVAEVRVDYNAQVKKGDVLAIIDPQVYGAQVTQQQANLAGQRAQLESASASAETARLAFERAARLYAQNLASKADLDALKGQYDVATANVGNARAAITAQQAGLSLTQANVGYTKILAPVDGIVVTRSIDPGATVVASFQAPVLFVIAQDLRKMRVLADIDEADVGRLKEKMDADCVVDAFPGESFRGVVQQVRYSPNTVQGVVTYSAVVEVDNPGDMLRPGMTATVTVRTNEAKQVLVVPNSALRYKPTPATTPDGKPIPPPVEPPLPKGQGRVYVVTSDVLGDEKAEPRVVPIGITDGISTQVVDGLSAGTRLVTDELDKKKKGFF